MSQITPKANIKFSQVHEDARVELAALKLVSESCRNIRGIVIASGGETLLSILANPLSDNFDRLDVLDINADQSFLAEFKLCLARSALSSLDLRELFNYPRIADVVQLSNPLTQWLLRNPQMWDGLNNIGEFEKIWADWRRDGNFSRAFARERLIEAFGEDAVKYSSRSFAEHFQQVVSNYGERSQNYFANWVLTGNMPPLSCDNPPFYRNLSHIKNYPVEKLHWIVGRLDLMMTPETYHFIHASNITDWTPSDVANELIDKIIAALRPGGVATLRRLNSDISLQDMLITKKVKIIPVEDRSGFYQEAYLIQKLG